MSFQPEWSPLRNARNRAVAPPRSKRWDPSWLLPVVDSLPEGVLVESDEKVVYVNRAFSQLLAYRRPADLIDRPLSEIAAEEDLPRLLDFGRRRCEGRDAPTNYEFLARRKDQRVVRLAASISSCTVADQVVITTVVRLVPEQPLSPDQIADLATVRNTVVPGLHLTLSGRELEVMEMVLQGLRSKEIGFSLGISEKTVATHRARLMKKMNLDNGKQLFQYALRHGLIDWK